VETGWFSLGHFLKFQINFENEMELVGHAYDLLPEELWISFPLLWSVCFFIYTKCICAANCPMARNKGNWCRTVSEFWCYYEA